MSAKRGFTLIELLGVIILLGIIGLIVFPNINRSIDASKENLYQEQVHLIEKYAQRWAVDHVDLIPDSGYYYLPLNELVKGNYITSKDIIDPRDDSVMNGCILVSESGYTYNEKTCDSLK